jgi:ribonuclease D
MIKTTKLEKIHVHQNDLPHWVDLEQEEVAVDTEAMGLVFRRDRLCLVQVSFNERECHLVQFSNGIYHKSPNLIKLLEHKKTQKIFHYARFDVGLLFNTFGVMTENIYCTKIASKLARTYTDRHGLKSLCSELLKVELSKKEQCSDWGRSNLSQEQQHYAASDVMNLVSLKEELNIMLEREGRYDLAKDCFEALRCVIKLECSGWSPENLFMHL